MDTQYHNYRRLALIVQDLADLEQYRPPAQEVAAYCARWGLRYEEVVGSDALLRRLVEVALALSEARPGGEDLPDLDYLVVPPGGTLDQAQFIR